MTQLSILDLIPIREGGSLPEAYAAAVELARTAERLGYKRFWVAEHHTMEGIAGAATSVVLAHIGNATSTIRIGAGGIMLPNHNPFVIADRFGAGTSAGGRAGITERATQEPEPGSRVFS